MMILQNILGSPSRTWQSRYVLLKKHLVESDVRTHAFTDDGEKIGPLIRYRNVLVPENRIQEKLQW